MTHLRLSVTAQAYAEAEKAAILDRVISCALPLLAALLDSKAVAVELELTGIPSKKIPDPLPDAAVLVAQERRPETIYPANEQAVADQAKC